MLGEITEKLANVILKLSITMDHLADLFLPNEMFINVTSKKYATEKYRIQHCLGKGTYMKIYRGDTLDRIIWSRVRI